jgi:hypothetical protein
VQHNSRPIGWIEAARKDFDDFPKGAQLEMARALTILAEVTDAGHRQHLSGFGSRVMEPALKPGDAHHPGQLRPPRTVASGCGAAISLRELDLLFWH